MARRRRYGLRRQPRFTRPADVALCMAPCRLTCSLSCGVLSVRRRMRRRMSAPVANEQLPCDPAPHCNPSLASLLPLLADAFDNGRMLLWH